MIDLIQISLPEGKKLVLYNLREARAELTEVHEPQPRNMCFAWRVERSNREEVLGMIADPTVRQFVETASF